MRFITNSSIREYIFEYLTSVDIFAYFLNVDEIEIYQCLYSPTHKIKNPQRIDKHPSLSFMNQNGTIRSKDWGDDKYSGDCFDVVGKMYGLNCNYAKDFMKICQIIISNILDGNEDIKISTEKDRHKLNKILKKKIQGYIKIIEFEERDINIIDINYWKQYEVNPYNLKKYYTYVPKRVWINNKLFYKYSHDNPAYIYFLFLYRQIPLYKVYCPLTQNYETKWRTNSWFQLERGFTGFNGGDIFIISEKTKDSISIEEILNNIKHNKIIKFANYNSASARLDQHISDFYKKRFNRIISITDNDDAGQRCGKYHKENYGFEHYTSILKDFTDTINSKYRNKEVENLIRFLFE